jgi:hypothetical protein
MSCGCDKNSSSSCGCDDCFSGVNIPQGLQGDNGLSAYEVAVFNGYIGTESQWVLSLKGETGEPGTNGTNGTDSFKYIKEVNSVFDGDIITVSQVELALAGVLPVGYIKDGLPQEFSDLHIQCWYLSAGSWRLINTPSVGGEIEVSINDTTGLISITLAFAPADPAVRVRIVIIG